MILSTQQAAVVNFVQNGNGSAFVQARAGTGKTSTLIEVLRVLKGEVAFCAFNKAIAEEVAFKVANSGITGKIEVGTFHKFGLKAWSRVHRGVKVEKNKPTMMNVACEVPDELRSFVAAIVSHAKNAGIGCEGSRIDDQEFWISIVDHHDMREMLEDDGDLEKAITFAIAGIKWSINIAHQFIDFDDMIFMPVLKNVRVWQRDWVLVDEAQDTNSTRRMFARKLLKANGRAIFVGDDRQAIYGFAGADADSIRNIVSGFRCTTFPLTVTYRCPKAVVREANKIVPDLEAHEEAPEGDVRKIVHQELMMQGLRADDAILCRNTKPLVETAYALIRKGIACHVEGREIGQGLLKLIARWSVKSVSDLRNRLEAYAEKQCSRLADKGLDRQAESLRDRVDTVLCIMDAHPACTTVQQLRDRIETMFVDGDKEPRKTLTLSTVHKAKGREWQRVFILGYHQLMPSPYAKQDWQIEQEDNLRYVAITRSQSELIFVNIEVARRD